MAEMLFRAKFMADLQSAQMRGTVSLSISQMQAIVNIASALITDPETASPEDH